MKMHARIGRLAAVLLVLFAGGCDDLLEVDPTEFVPPGVATGNAGGVQAVLIGAYQRLQAEDAYASQMIIVPEILADNARTSSPPQQFQAQYVNQAGAHLGGWALRYQAINDVNYVIAAAPNLADAAQPQRDRLLGEALFLRALNYFDLSRIYAYEPGRAVNGWDTGVVLRTAPTLRLEDAEFRPRSTVAETYAQIEADLRESITRLSAAGGTSVYFATRTAAEALLARVFLYAGRWDDAITQATAAMTSTSARLAAPAEVATMFNRQPNVESIFEIQFNVFNQNAVNFCMWCHLHPDGSFFSVWPSAELLATFEPADARLALYPTTANGTRYTAKWTASAGAYNDHIPVLRYSEVLLTRAEAYARSGQDGPAQADLNRLRENRGLGPITATGAALVAAVLAERRRELAFEGHRWFDLKRSGMDIPKPAHSGLPPLPYTDIRILAGLPNAQVQSNPLLQQNPGY